MSSPAQWTSGHWLGSAKVLGLTCLCNILKFSYGYIFGYLMWLAIIHPYERFYDFQRGSYLPSLVFSSIIALIFVSFLWARSIMVLFLPSMLGNAGQNYVIVLLVVALFANPVTNVALNVAESVRVLGCSLTMTFEQLKERAKLILNPIVEVLRDTNHTDLAPIGRDLVQIQQIVTSMSEEAQFNRLQSEGVDLKRPQSTTTQAPSMEEIANDISRRLKVGPEIGKQIVNKTRGLISDSSFDLNDMAFKTSIDVEQLQRLARTNLSVAAGRSVNLTDIMYENCLSILTRAKSNCEDGVEKLREGIADKIGSFLTSLWFGPLLFTASSTCPWLMDQLIDENNLCNQLRNSTPAIHADPFGITGGADINEVYKNLTQQVESFTGDLVNPTGNQKMVPRRLELSITFNQQTKSIFSKARNMVRFLQDKYRIRRLFYDILLFVYELYTSYTFICVIYQAYRYRRNYLNHIRFDNHYITGSFVALDRRRIAMGKSGVLPLTKDESERFITTFTCRRRTREERHIQRASCWTAILFLSFSLITIYLDNIFYSILSSVHEHALVRFKEIGHHELNVRVFGDGAAARLVRRLTARLSSVYDLDKLSSSQHCLPEPKRTSNTFYADFAYLSLIYLGLDQLSIYAMRLRRVTAAFFYPDKEKQRTRFLHSLIRMQRESFRRTGLIDYVDEDASVSNQAGGMFTVRDALAYIGNCAQESFRCRCLSRRAHGL